MADILDFIRAHRGATKDEIREVFKDDGALRDLFADGVIDCDEQGRYYLLSDLHLAKGTYHKRSRGGLVKFSDLPDLYVRDEFCDQDVVVVSLYTGRVKRVLEHGLKNLTGIYRLGRRYGIVHAINPVISQPVRIIKGSANKNDLVVVRLTSYPSRQNNYFQGEIVRVIGAQDEPGADISAVIADSEVPDEFSAEVLEEAGKIPLEVSDISGRVDFRDEMVVTIDGDDARDFDDAISVSKDDLYHLQVHIADVSYYVRKDSALDLAATVRGTSIYLPDRVLPMLPEALSNGICSLRPGQDRLTISCLMDIDEVGNVVESRIVAGVIRSQCRMTYDRVNRFFEGGDDYKPFAKMLLVARELAEILRRKRKKRGAIDFDTPEARVVLDEAGKTKALERVTPGIAEEMIESFMIQANETVAGYMRWLGVPYIYRVHEKPERAKIVELMGMLKGFGYHLEGSWDDLHPRALQAMMAESKGRPEESLVAVLALRCMPRARYDEQCLGHFGLADEEYTHFTSPIRRYPDLLGHRLIRKYVLESDFQDVSDDEKRVRIAASQSSFLEQRAVDVERRVEAMKKAEFMAGHVGEVYTGMVSSVTGYGLYVELDNTVNGLLHISELPDDDYYFDENHKRLLGQYNGLRFNLLEKIKVRVLSADKWSGKVSFAYAGAVE